MTIIPEKRKAGEKPGQNLKPHFHDKYYGHVGFDGEATILPNTEKSKKSISQGIPHANIEPITNSNFPIAQAEQVIQSHPDDYAGIGVKPERFSAFPEANLNNQNTIKPLAVEVFPETAEKQTASPNIDLMHKVSDHPTCKPVKVGELNPDLMVAKLEEQRKYEETNPTDGYPYPER